jgi:hypothetical protein
MSSTISAVSSTMAFLALFFSSFIYAPQSAQAMTVEEFLRLLQVLGRTAEDVERTFGPDRQQPPQMQPTPEPTNNPFDPQLPAEFQPQQPSFLLPNW